MPQNSTHSGTATAVDVQIMETYGGVKVYVHLFLALVLARVRWLLSFEHQHLYTWGKSSLYPL